MFQPARGGPYSAARATQMAWTIWGALAMGAVVFPAAVLLGATRPAGETSGGGEPRVEALQVASLVLLPLAAVVGWRVRDLLWRRGTSDGVLAPQSRLTGQIVLWAALEGAAHFGSVVLLLGGPSPLRVAVPAAGLLGLLLSAPVGSSGRLGGAAGPSARADHASRGDRT